MKTAPKNWRDITLDALVDTKNELLEWVAGRLSGDPERASRFEQAIHYGLPDAMFRRGEVSTIPLPQQEFMIRADPWDAPRGGAIISSLNDKPVFTQDLVAGGELFPHLSGGPSGGRYLISTVGLNEESLADPQAPYAGINSVLPYARGITNLGAGHLNYPAVLDQVQSLARVHSAAHERPPEEFAEIMPQGFGLKYMQSGRLTSEDGGPAFMLAQDQRDGRVTSLLFGTQVVSHPSELIRNGQPSYGFYTGANEREHDQWLLELKDMGLGAVKEE